MLVWSIFLGLVTLAGLQQYVTQADPALPSTVYALNITMRLSVVAYLVVIAATVVERDAAGGEGAQYRYVLVHGGGAVPTIAADPYLCEFTKYVLLN